MSKSTTTTARARLRGLGQALLVLAITLTLILVMLEIALRLFAPQIVAPISGLFVADTATAYRLKPGARVPFRFAEGSSTFAVNEQGLRMDGPVGTPLAAGTRLLCLGDSFVFGMGVEAAQAFPHLLDGAATADGKRIESINAGVFGYGTDNEAAWLRAYGAALRPQTILVGFYVGNDVKDVALGMDKTTVNEAGRLVATDKSREVMETADDDGNGGGGLREFLATNSHAYLFTRNLFYRLVPPKRTVRAPTLFDSASFFLRQEPPEVTAGLQKTLGYLDQIREQAAELDARLVVVLIPTREQVHDEYWAEMKTQFDLSEEQLARDLPQSRLAAWGKSAGVEVLDLLPRFQDEGKSRPLYFRTDKHWNAAGHQLAAEVIRTALGLR